MSAREGRAPCSSTKQARSSLPLSTNTNPSLRPRSGWAEQDPQDWWKACQGAVRKLLRESAIPASEIACIGLSGQMHGAVLLDRNDEVLRPALIWCDQRTEAECRYLNETIGPRRIVELTSNPALTNFTLTKLLWVRTNEPGIWRRFQSFLLPKDYIRLCLTGVRAIDVADASGTLLLDVAHRRWSDAMLDAVGLNPDCLPALYESQEVVGQVTEAAAASTGLKAGTPVVAGAGDQAAGATGMGIVRPGDVSATIGTSGVVFAASDAPVTDPQGRLHTFCHAIPGRWHVMGVTQAAGLSLRWFRDNFGVAASRSGAHPADPYDQLSAEAAQVPPGSGGVLWAPYLMGERTPHLDPNARAALVGLAADHTRANVVRAILEGVAFSLKDTLTIFKELGIPVRAIRVGGRWRPLTPVAADSGGCLRPDGGNGAGRGRRRLWRRPAGRGGRRRLDFGRCGLRQSGACGQAHRPRPGCLPRDAGELTPTTAGFTRPYESIFP